MIEQNLERTFSPDPFGQMGGYIKRMRGVRLDFKAENPPLHRIERLFVEGAPVEPDKSYRAAFITSRGVPAHLGRNLRDLPVHAVEALRTRLGDSPFRGALETVRGV